MGGAYGCACSLRRHRACSDAVVWYNCRFAIELNDPSDHIAPHLPPTDARFRPDQRALETGEFGRATTEKLRLEEKQRQVRAEGRVKGRASRANRVGGWG